eukprot:GFUD01136010.1.p1 GENE.GFUD01136010.1~~GFUD01136010.1.p1  ORF type:complete len:139 (+),score=16.96 GFUD01136010.1:329-745(+)
MPRNNSKKKDTGPIAIIVKCCPTANRNMPTAYPHRAQFDDEDAAEDVIDFSVLSLRDKKAKIELKLQLQYYILFYLTMASVVLRLCLATASAFILLAIILVIICPILERESYKLVQQQLLALVRDSAYKRLNNLLDEE